MHTSQNYVYFNEVPCVAEREDFLDDMLIDRESPPPIASPSPRPVANLSLSLATSL